MGLARKLFAEMSGTAMLVFFGVGVATMMFGFKFDGGSVASGVIATALAFGFVLLALVYSIGPISGCHVNPAVTLGALLNRRIPVTEAIGYWVAQFVGGIVGGAMLLGVVGSSPLHDIEHTGLGTNGFGPDSQIHIGWGDAFFTEMILTGLFVFVILAVTAKAENTMIAGLVIGITLTVVILLGIPIDGTSVNPARSVGPALLVGGRPLDQVWLFIVGPLAGAVVAAAVYYILYPTSKAGQSAAAHPTAQSAMVQPAAAPAGAGQPMAASDVPRQSRRSIRLPRPHRSTSAR